MKPMEKMKNMKKSRRGAALIMALVVVLVGGLFITVVFNFVSQHGVFSQAERGMYVDHTTLVSHLQSMKGRIVADNLAASDDYGVARHTGAVTRMHEDETPEERSLILDDLRFGGRDGDDVWRMKKEPVSSGLGVQYVDVEVYDMYFELGWIDQIELQKEGFPPTFNMIGVVDGDTDWIIPGRAIADDLFIPKLDGTKKIRPEYYGAYLVRARLFEHRDSDRPLRTMEEAFVQLLLPED